MITIRFDFLGWIREILASITKAFYWRWFRSEDVVGFHILFAHCLLDPSVVAVDKPKRALDFSDGFLTICWNRNAAPPPPTVDGEKE